MDPKWRRLGKESLEGERQDKHNARKRFNPLAWQTVGSVSTVSLFCAGSNWWRVLQKLHCQTTLKTHPLTIGWLVLGTGHEFKQKINKSWQLCSKISPTCILPVRTSVQCLLEKKNGAKNTVKQSYFPPCQDEWPFAGGREWRSSSPKQLFIMHLVCAILALRWFGLKWSGRPDLGNWRMWVQGGEFINTVLDIQVWRDAVLSWTLLGRSYGHSFILLSPPKMLPLAPCTVQ